MELANFAAESVSSFPLMPTYAGIRENKTFPFMCTSLKFIFFDFDASVKICLWLGWLIRKLILCIDF